DNIQSILNLYPPKQNQSQDKNEVNEKNSIYLKKIDKLNDVYYEDISTGLVYWSSYGERTIDNINETIDIEIISKYLETMNDSKKNLDKLKETSCHYKKDDVVVVTLVDCVNWFINNNILLLGNKLNIKKPVFDELKLLLNKRGFCIQCGKEKTKINILPRGLQVKILSVSLDSWETSLGIIIKLVSKKDLNKKNDIYQVSLNNGSETKNIMRKHIKLTECPYCFKTNQVPLIFQCEYPDHYIISFSQIESYVNHYIKEIKETIDKYNEKRIYKNISTI
ncbi:unnamed protein product, partial [marine sediment metagenome]